ncbi:MAG: TRAP transporter large permease [Methylobacteriaceae bacterium]|jgi:C4-dicarboxylate transporter DctM subunit|nr:TRAP transporter large permease [Methylobacteriaceae bacterium]
MSTLWILLGLFAVLLAFGTPIGAALSLASAFIFIFIDGRPLIILPQKFFNATDSFSFLAVPFFMLAGAFMSDGGVTKRIVDFSMCLVGFLAGGLALVVAMAGMFFAALSGSSAATTAAIGASMINEMEERGYPRDFAAAVVAAGGTVGIVIPPSITMVVYGSIANVGIADLFMAGFAPGICMGVAMMVLSWVFAKIYGYGSAESFSLIRAAKMFLSCLPALLMPVIILGGIYAGFFTPTEAAAVAALYGAFVGFFIYGELKLSDLPKTLYTAAVGTTMIMFVVGGAAVLGHILTNARIPHQLGEAFTQLTDSPVIFLMLLNVMLLFVGTLVNASAAVVILTPILLPVAVNLGIDPLFFGVLMVVNLAIGCITPPVGLDLFVVSSIAGVSIGRVTQKVLPYIGVLVAVLLLVTYVPKIITFMPEGMGYVVKGAYHGG